MRQKPLALSLLGQKVGGLLAQEAGLLAVSASIITIHNCGVGESNTNDNDIRAHISKAPGADWYRPDPKAGRCASS